MTTIKLVPITGKYVSISLGERTYEIWRVNPVTGEIGTDVDYSVAVKLLKLNPIQVSEALNAEGGKFTSALNDADIADVNLARENAPSILKEYKVIHEDSKDATSAVLAKAMETIQAQSSFIAAQAKKVEEMKGVVDQLKAKSDGEGAPAESAPASAPGGEEAPAEPAPKSKKR